MKWKKRKRWNERICNYFSHGNKGFVTISNAKPICSRVFLFLSVHAQTLKNERKKKLKKFSLRFSDIHIIHIHGRIHLYIHSQNICIHIRWMDVYAYIRIPAKRNGKGKNLKMAAHEYMCYTDLEVFSIRFPYTYMCIRSTFFFFQLNYENKTQELEEKNVHAFTWFYNTWFFSYFWKTSLHMLNQLNLTRKKYFFFISTQWLNFQSQIDSFPFHVFVRFFQLKIEWQSIKF